MDRRKARKPRSPRNPRRESRPDVDTQIPWPLPSVAKSRSQPVLSVQQDPIMPLSLDPQIPQSMDEVLLGQGSGPVLGPLVARSSAAQRPLTTPPRDIESKLSTSDIPPRKLRRKKSTIGIRPAEEQIPGPTKPSISASEIDSQAVLPPRSSSLHTSSTRSETEASPAAPVRAPSQQLHPALRERSLQEHRLSVTPLSYAPSTTPSTRHTASPAFSQLSSRTSVSSYSPNLPSTAFQKDDRRGPSLPFSPKAFKESSQRPVSSTSKNSDERRRSRIPPEFAHLNFDSARPTSPNSPRPKRPSRDGIPDLSSLQTSTPVVHSHLSPRSASSTDRLASPAPSREGRDERRRFFGFRSRSNSRDTRDRQDPGIHSSIPNKVESKESLTGRTTPGTAATSLSQENETSTRTSSASRFGRLLSRATDTKKPPRVGRKGPAAGTGHEGYGRFGFRGRNFSFSSLSSAGRSGSVDSTASRASSRNRSIISSHPAGSEPGEPRTLEARTAERSPSRTSAVDRDALVRSGLLGKSSAKRADGADFAERVKAGGLDSAVVLNSSESSSIIGMNRIDRSATEAPDGPSSRQNQHVPIRTRSRRDSGIEETETPSTKPKKWNFLQRAQAKMRNASSVPQSSVSPHLRARPGLGFYAHETVDPPPGLEDAERVIGDVRIQSTSSAEQEQEQKPSVVPYDSRHSSLLPSPPLHLSRRNASGQHQRPPSFRMDSSETPEVLQATLASRNPFSMPEHGSSANEPSRWSARPTVRALGIQNLDVAGDAVSTHNSTVSNESFLAFPRRKDSDISYTSSSATPSFRSGTTLVGHAPSTPWLGDEDVWNEYNDLLDYVLPPKVPPKNKAEDQQSRSMKPAPLNLGRENVRPESKYLPEINSLVEDIQGPVSAQNDDVATDSPNRISQFLQPLATPSTPYSLSDIMAGYGEQTPGQTSNKAGQDGQGEARRSVESGYSSQYSRTSGPSRPLTQFEGRDVISPVPEEREAVPDVPGGLTAKPSRRSAGADLRFGALMTSKWLSFGRVLFSPAHNEMRNGEDVRVLVVDGLGKDWSYYCALTYPNATFYNLEVVRDECPPSGRGKDLANYRNVRHSSLGAPFPFRRGFFTAIVFRFPIATTDKAYHACVYECKRVLRPGGFLELSVLDLDMMNMGNHARRALRSLKIDMQAANDQVSLRNMGDTMITLIGRRGFENIQRCAVGIPVAGKIPRSRDWSSDSSERESLQAAISAHERGEKAVASKDFAGIIYGRQSASTTKPRDNDEGITKMVAKVGRWWYSSCYGAVAGEEEDAMWQRPGLLRECERQGTAFRLLLCYAQKPTCPPRRTASV